MATMKQATKKTTKKATANRLLNGAKAAAKEASQTKVVKCVIPRANILAFPFHVKGTAPLVQHAFSRSKRREMMAKQAAGSQAQSKKPRDPKDFEKLFKDAAHRSTEGWYGIPAPAFRSAMIDACRLVGFKMTYAKLSVFIQPDGFDEQDGTPLVKMHGGEPERHEAAVRNATGVIDTRVRPMWREWSAVVTVRWDDDQFSLSDVANLLERAGMQVGIGEGRPNSKKSHGQGWGTFHVDMDAVSEVVG